MMMSQTENSLQENGFRFVSRFFFCFFFSSFFCVRGCCTNVTERPPLKSMTVNNADSVL